MSALARILLEQGHTVKGSDSKESQTLVDLAAAGATIYREHKASHIQADDIVVYSSSIANDHVEYQAALRKNVPLYHRSACLDQLLQAHKPLLVTGAHGKTTITTLLSYFLQEGNWDPSYVVGGFSPSLASNGHWGGGPYFVAEADESDGSFLRSTSYGAIIANIDKDHLEYWHTEEALIAGYRQFIDQVAKKDLLVWYGDDVLLTKEAPSLESVGYYPHNKYQIRDHSDGTYSVQGPDMVLQHVESPLIGIHNRINSALAMVLAYKLGVSQERLHKAMGSFSHVQRRLEYLGTGAHGIACYSDYAHHPREILATYQALQAQFPQRRIWVILQPHRYSRVRTLYKEFQCVCAQIPYLIVTDIYAAGELPSGDTPIDANCYVAQSRLTSHIQTQWQEGDVLVAMGAGDIDQWVRQLVLFSRTTPEKSVSAL